MAKPVPISQFDEYDVEKVNSAEDSNSNIKSYILLSFIICNLFVIFALLIYQYNIILYLKNKNKNKKPFKKSETVNSFIFILIYSISTSLIFLPIGKIPNGIRLSIFGLHIFLTFLKFWFCILIVQNNNNSEFRSFDILKIIIGDIIPLLIYFNSFHDLYKKKDTYLGKLIFR